MEAVKVFKPSKVIRTNYAEERFPQMIDYLVTQTKALDEEHGVPKGSVKEGETLTIECRVHDSTMARLLMMPILVDDKGDEPTIGLSLPGLDIQRLTRAPLDSLLKEAPVDENEVVKTWLKRKLNDLKYNGDVNMGVPEDQAEFYRGSPNEVEALLNMFLEEIEEISK